MAPRPFTDQAVLLRCVARTTAWDDIRRDILTTATERENMIERSRRLRAVGADPRTGRDIAREDPVLGAEEASLPVSLRAEADSGVGSLARRLRSAILLRPAFPLPSARCFGVRPVPHLRPRTGACGQLGRMLIQVLPAARRGPLWMRGNPSLPPIPRRRGAPRLLLRCQRGPLTIAFMLRLRSYGAALIDRQRRSGRIVIARPLGRPLASIAFVQRGQLLASNRGRPL